MRYLMFVIFSIIFVSCKTKSYIETEKIVYHHDTVVVNTYVTDTLIEELHTIVHDSIHVVCDTTGNVVYKEVYKYIEKESNKEEKASSINSEIVVMNDSVISRESKEVVKEKKDYYSIINLVIILIIAILVYKSFRLMFDK